MTLDTVFTTAAAVVGLVGAVHGAADLRATVPAPDRWWRFHQPTLVARRRNGAAALGASGMLLCHVAGRVFDASGLALAGSVLCVALGLYWSNRLERSLAE